MRSSAVLAAFLALWCGDPRVWAQSGAPLSAIDWLSDSVSLPAALSDPASPGRSDQPAVTGSALPGIVTVRPLDAPGAGSLGLYPARRAGLPKTLWAASDLADLSDRMVPDRPLALPAAQDLLRQMVEARTAPPRGAEDETFFLMRVDALLAMGAVEPARALLRLGDRETPAAFRRWFDMALLTGRENVACERMRALPDITPTYPARIFCLARSGDWMAAALTLETARALDVVTPEETDALTRFLDDQSEGGMLPQPHDPTPLDMALFEAFGEPLRTEPQPLAFSHMDLRRNTGWKARIEAAERLAHAGALSPDRLWSVCNERAPAASGGVWDGVEAVQTLDRAIAAGNADGVSQWLPAAWDELQAAGLAHLLARRHSAALRDLDLGGRAGEIALRMRLLAGGTGDGAAAADREDRFLLALARGAPGEEAAPSDMGRAVADGFAADAAPTRTRRLLEANRTGEALLVAVGLLEDGAAGNLDAVRDGLATLRAAGLEDRAVMAGLELLILEPRS